MQKVTAMLQKNQISLNQTLKVVVTELNGKPTNKETIKTLCVANVRNKNAKKCQKHLRRTFARLYN